MKEVFCHKYVITRMHRVTDGIQSIEVITVTETKNRQMEWDIETEVRDMFDTADLNISHTMILTGFKDE